MILNKKIEVEDIYSEELTYFIKNRLSLIGIIEATVLNDNSETMIRTSPMRKLYLNTCIFHNHLKDNKYRFFIDIEEKYYVCHSCGSRGTSVSFLAKYYNISMDESIEILAVLLDIFSLNILNEKQLKILKLLKENYIDCDEKYLKICDEKLDLYKEKIIRLINHYINIDKDISEKKLANRLSLSLNLVIKILNELEKNKEQYEKIRRYKNSYDLKQLLKQEKLESEKILIHDFSDLPF